MAVNVAMLKKGAVDFARSDSEGLQGSYRVGGGRGSPPSNTIALATGRGGPGNSCT